MLVFQAEKENADQLLVLDKLSVGQNNPQKIVIAYELVVVDYQAVLIILADTLLCDSSVVHISPNHERNEQNDQDAQRDETSWVVEQVANRNIPEIPNRQECERRNQIVPAHIEERQMRRGAVDSGGVEAAHHDIGGELAGALVVKSADRLRTVRQSKLVVNARIGVRKEYRDRAARREVLDDQWLGRSVGAAIRIEERHTDNIGN
eukprot:37360_1